MSDQTGGAGTRASQERPGRDRQAAGRRSPTGRGPAAATLDLAAWIGRRRPVLAERWAQGLLAGEGWKGSGEALLRPFCRGLVSFLPAMVGPSRTEVVPLWTECAELFGSVAARRGLSAGEVIEEFQLLREVILRDILEGRAAVPLERAPAREVLLLNRALDLGVTQASVGHTDLLFFSLLHGSGAPDALGGGELEELRDQIAQLREAGRRTVLHAARIRSG